MKITDKQLKSFLDEFDAWSLQHEKLHREYLFGNFDRAFEFMTRVALRAGRMDHHPEWFNSCGTVVVDLTTHSAAGITMKDFELAKEMEAIADTMLAEDCLDEGG